MSRLNGNLSMDGGMFPVSASAPSSRLKVSESETNVEVRSYVRKVDTTDATQATESFAVPSDATILFSVLIVARRTDADDESAAYEIKGCIDNNAGTTALVGSITKTVLAEDTAAWDVTAEADDTGDNLDVKVTGEAAKNITWGIYVTLLEANG